MQEILELFRNALMISLDQPETSPEKTSLILHDSTPNYILQRALSVFIHTVFKLSCEYVNMWRR